MKYLLLSLLLGLSQPLLARAPLSPLQIARQFVARQGWPAMKDHLCCEARQQARQETLGQQLPARWQRHCALLTQDARTAVVAVELRDSVRRNDFYLHFSKEEDSWKLQAIRSLAMTQLGPPMLKLLAAMPPAEVALYNQKHPDADHAYTLGNLQLWIGADADTSRHLLERKADFQRVLGVLETRGYLQAPDTTVAAEQAANADPVVRDLLRTLYISRVARPDTGGGIAFIIGGRIDNTVGLLYQPHPAAVPPMHPDRLIVVRPITDSWYLYKTTRSRL